MIEWLNDLEQIKLFISSDNVIISEKVISSIINTIQYLSVFPNLWVSKNEIYREIVEPAYKYKIRYKIESNYIYIMTIYKFKNK